jgi:hypothetical protein
MNGFVTAARLVGVSEAAFKVWLMERKDPSPVQWSKWKSGREQIGNGYLVDFLLEEKMRTAGLESKP